MANLEARNVQSRLLKVKLIQGKRSSKKRGKDAVAVSCVESCHVPRTATDSPRCTGASAHEEKSQSVIVGVSCMRLRAKYANNDIKKQRLSPHSEQQLLHPLHHPAPPAGDTKLFRR